MKTFNNLNIGQIVKTENGTACVYSFTSYGTRRGDIRPEVINSKVEMPTLKGIDFVGFVNVVPDSVNFLYGHEVKASFIK